MRGALADDLPNQEHSRKKQSSTSTGTMKAHTSEIANFVFGYGSLICSHSRRITVPEQAHKVATPVVANGVERMWSKRTNRGMTAMGVRFEPDAQCVGVLLPVNETELRSFDKREQGYDRKRLSLDQVDLVSFLDPTYYQSEDHAVFVHAKQQKNDRKIALWVYVQRDPLPPTPEHPIVQSYVDVILRGCLSISEEFAKEFIETTVGWHPKEMEHIVGADSETGSSSNQDTERVPYLDSNAAANEDDRSNSSDSDQGAEDEDDDDAIWVDDRQRPIYIRGDPQYSRKKARELDRLLKRHRPQHFTQRQPLPIRASE